MNCPKCESDTCIIDCRQKNGNLFYRRHECKSCRERFTTVESVVAKKAAVAKAAKKDAAEKTALEIVALELGRAKAKHPDFPYLYSDRLSIIAEELGIPMTEVTKCGGASKLLVGTLTQIAKEARPDEN